jgi:hypothetical protein
MFKQLAFAAGMAVMAPCLALAAQPSQAPAASINPQAPSGGSPQLGHESSKQSLAQRLSQSNGTIQPPAVDPGMDKLPPAAGTAMPVLKPPPNVQSK